MRADREHLPELARIPIHELLHYGAGVLQESRWRRGPVRHGSLLTSIQLVEDAIDFPAKQSSRDCEGGTVSRSTRQQGYAHGDATEAAGPCPSMYRLTGRTSRPKHHEFSHTLIVWQMGACTLVIYKRGTAAKVFILVVIAVVGGIAMPAIAGQPLVCSHWLVHTVRTPPLVAPTQRGKRTGTSLGRAEASRPAALPLCLRWLNLREAYEMSVDLLLPRNLFALALLSGLLVDLLQLVLLRGTNRKKT